MALVMEREPPGCGSFMLLAGTVLADPEPMLARLVCGCIAMAFTARLPALLVCTALLMPSRAASSAAWAYHASWHGLRVG